MRAGLSAPPGARVGTSPILSSSPLPNSRERRVIIPYEDQTLRPPHYLTPRVEKKDGCTSGGPFLWQSSGEGAWTLEEHKALPQGSASSQRRESTGVQGSTGLT